MTPNPNSKGLAGLGAAAILLAGTAPAAANPHKPAKADYSIARALPAAVAVAAADTAKDEADAAFEFPAAREVRLIDADEVDRMLRTHGADLLVVNFWATTCGPCIREMPYFERIWKENKDEGVVFVGFSTDNFVFDDWHARVVALLERLDVTFPNFGIDVDPQTFIPSFDENWGGEQPATFFYNAEGEQVHKILGEISEADLRALVARLRGAEEPAEEATEAQ